MYHLRIVVKEAYNQFTESMQTILFLTNASANIGNIAYYCPLEGHGEASIDYYLKCKHLKDSTEADKLVHFYEKLWPGEVVCVRAFKQTANDRLEAYSGL